MPYDPQRSHRRPRLADDQPAPIDALLDAELPRDTDPSPPSSNGARAAVEAPVSPAPLATPVAPPDTGASARPGGRPRLALAALVVVVLLLAVAWLRRRR